MASRWHLIDEPEIIWLIADHSAQRRLCSVLEDFADALPILPSMSAVLHVEQQLATYADRHFPSEIALFQRFFANASCPSSECMLQEIRQNHAVDAMHADDLSDELRRISGSSRADHPGELAYMLRCFFDGSRRAMAFEELALLNAGGDYLTAAARDAVLQSFRAGRS